MELLIQPKKEPLESIPALSGAQKVQTMHPGSFNMELAYVKNINYDIINNTVVIILY